MKLSRWWQGWVIRRRRTIAFLLGARFDIATGEVFLGKDGRKRYTWYHLIDEWYPVFKDGEYLGYSHSSGFTGVAEAIKEMERGKELNRHIRELEEEMEKV